MMKIAVVGSLNVDRVVRVERFARPGETLIARSLEVFPGGKGANQAYAAAKLIHHHEPGGAGVTVEMIGQVGGDAYAAFLRDSLRTAGTLVDGIAVDEAAPSGTAMITIDDAGQNQIVIVPGANGSFSPDRLSRSAATLAGAKIVLLQLEIPIETVTHAARLGHAAGALVILDPAPARPLPEELWRLLDYLTPNESELRALLGHPPSEEALSRDEAVGGARALKDRGARNVVVKLGAAGALLLLDDQPEFIAPFAVTPVDTTAAGDAWNAGFAVALCEGQAPRDAARFANATAACAVTRKGAQPGMPTRAEVRQLLGG